MRTPSTVEIFAKLLEEAGDIMNSGSAFWWRGQGRDWQLKPGVFRPGSRGEKVLIQEFEIQAPVRYPKWPSSKVDRLMLMQHFGLPTRVLDWSISFLVALFFAVETVADKDEQGIVYAINPVWLNEQSHESFHLTSDSEPISLIVEEAYEQRVGDDGRVLAFRAREIDFQMTLQSSAFTIHHDPRPLNEIFTDIKSVVILPEWKKTLETLLKQLGVHRAALFPDLPTLAGHIKGNVTLTDIETDVGEDGLS